MYGSSQKSYRTGTKQTVPVLFLSSFVTIIMNEEMEKMENYSFFTKKVKRNIKKLKLT
jgi:glutathionyl-hydroquinone reductase